MIAVPPPTLVYHFWRREEAPDVSDVTPEAGSPYLFSLNKATASMGPDGLWLSLEGPMLKQDGERGKHNRCCTVDLGAPQPQWINDLADDAIRRLAVTS